MDKRQRLSDGVNGLGHVCRLFRCSYEAGREPQFKVDYGRKIMTVRDALEDKRLKKAGPGLLMGSSLVKMMRYVKPGEYLREVYPRLTKQQTAGVIRPGFMPRRLDPDEPMGAFLSVDHFVHPKENRFIGLNEAKILCGYPLNFKIERPETSPSTQGRLLSRAVLPPVAKWLGQQINSLLDQKGAARTKRRPKPTARLYDLRKPNTPFMELEV